MSEGIIARFWHWLIGRISSEVPLEIALCECDCRKLECPQGRWQYCERRLAFIEQEKLRLESERAQCEQS